MTRAAAARAAIAVIVVVSCATTFSSASPASAHASLVRSSPADGAVVATAPRAVTLVFDENIREPSVVVVTADDGTSAKDGRTTITDNVARTSVRITEAGHYTVAYRVVSADGHPVTGDLSFSVGLGAATGSADGAAAPGTHVHHHTVENSGAGWGAPRVVGTIAGVALLLGLGLLTIRRWAPSLRAGR